MQLYQNRSGHSGVVAFDIRSRSIAVKFVDGGVYLYSYIRPGAADVEAMKKLALRGEGLATYINQNVRDVYERKLA